MDCLFQAVVKFDCADLSLPSAGRVGLCAGQEHRIIIIIMIIIIIIIMMALPRQHFHRVALHPPGGPTALHPCPRNISNLGKSD